MPGGSPRLATGRTPWNRTTPDHDMTNTEHSVWMSLRERHFVGESQRSFQKCRLVEQFVSSNVPLLEGGSASARQCPTERLDQSKGTEEDDEAQEQGQCTQGEEDHIAEDDAKQPRGQEVHVPIPRYRERLLEAAIE